MVLWVVASAAALAGLLAVLLAVVTEPDRPTPQVPAPLPPVTPEELRNPDLPVVRRGYDVGAVDRLLLRAATTLERRWAPDGQPSGEELENGGGDGTGRLDG